VMLSIEPVLRFDLAAFPLWIAKVNPSFVVVGYDSGHNRLPEPELKSVLFLVELLEKAGVKVYRKLLREKWNHATN
jgi:hypothetical protein